MKEKALTHSDNRRGSRIAFVTIIPVVGIRTNAGVVSIRIKARPIPSEQDRAIRRIHIDDGIAYRTRSGNNTADHVVLAADETDSIRSPNACQSRPALEFWLLTEAAFRLRLLFQ